MNLSNQQFHKVKCHVAHFILKAVHLSVTRVGPEGTVFIYTAFLVTVPPPPPLYTHTPINNASC